MLAEFEEVCHAHGVSGKAFRVVAEPFPALTPPARTSCLPGFNIAGGGLGGLEQEADDAAPGGGDDDPEESGGRNGHGEGWEDGEGEQGLGASRVDCFSDSLDRCVGEGLHSCPQLRSALAKAACFYNYITSAVPPEKLRQVLDGPGGVSGKPGSFLPDIKDWASQLKVCGSVSLMLVMDCGLGLQCQSLTLYSGVCQCSILTIQGIRKEHSN